MGDLNKSLFKSVSIFSSEAVPIELKLRVQIQSTDIIFIFLNFCYRPWCPGTPLTNSKLKAN